ncbi:MAG TPA: RICIN domain-containing protein [Chthoniobacterales bacterium]|nr:RICIN domain-containing protein [Chthoniobacterales bacterium]
MSKEKPGQPICIWDGSALDPDGQNWNVDTANIGETKTVGNALSGLFLDCPAATGPGGGVIETAFFLDNTSPTQQWNFELVKVINAAQNSAGQNIILNGYWIRNRFNNLVLTVPGVDQPGFSPANGIHLTLDFAFQPLKASQIWIAMIPN